MIANLHNAPPSEVIETIRAGFIADGDTLIGFRMETESDPDNAGMWRARAWTFIGHKQTLEIDAHTHLGTRSSMVHAV